MHQLEVHPQCAVVLVLPHCMLSLGPSNLSWFVAFTIHYMLPPWHMHNLPEALSSFQSTCLLSNARICLAFGLTRVKVASAQLAYGSELTEDMFSDVLHCESKVMSCLGLLQHV
jgi:hypothetical protein